MNKRVFLILFLVFTVVLSANPFMGSQDSVQRPATRDSSGSTIQELAKLQLHFREQISGFFEKLNTEERTQYILLIMGFAVLYGIVHAAGPGHRKTIIFSLFIGREAKWWEPFTAGFFAAAVHALNGLILILVMHTLSQAMLSYRVNAVSVYFEGWTYAVLMVLAFILFVLKLLELLGKRHHSHGSEKAQSRSLYSILFAASLFPCPVSIMIMLFSLAVNQVLVGMLAIAALSLGMGITISLVAYLAYTGRKTMFHLIKKREHTVEKLGALMEMGAYAFLFLFSLWAVTPFLLSFLA